MSSRTAANRVGGFRQPKSDRGQIIESVTGVPQVAGAGLAELSLTAISPNPDNPREELEGIAGLAESIRTFGLLQPLIVVRREAFVQGQPGIADALQSEATHVVIDGHRRLAAAAEANLETVPVIIQEDASASEENVLGVTFITQFHAMRLSPLAQSAIVKSLISLHGSQEAVAEVLGITQSRVSQILSFNRLSDELQAGLAAGTYSAEDVKSLGRRSPELQKEIADERRVKRQRRKTAKVDAPASSPASPPPAAPQLPAQTAPEVTAGSTEVAAGDLAVAAEAAPALEHGSAPVVIDVRKLTRTPWESGSKLAALAIDKMTREEIGVLISELTKHLGE
ncbi:ParB/RepB/Spo0J family partition protein [Streptomyces goshikiensis]|uniref:ParB/RepB/Spo0J family partition protein n=1 Tax=Streptomyces goshikiensis TaxID=1942 RepID=UPI00369E3C62